MRPLPRAGEGVPADASTRAIGGEGCLLKRCTAIERTAPRPGGVEVPALSRRGYESASPRQGAEKHHAEHAVFVRTLGEAVALIVDEAHSIRMGRPGPRPSLIGPGKLRITWV